MAERPVQVSDFEGCGCDCGPDTKPWPHTMIWGQCAYALRGYQGERPVIVEEYGHLMFGGNVQVWDLAPRFLAIYPLDERIEHGRQHGGKVRRRRIIILDEWEEAT